MEYYDAYEDVYEDDLEDDLDEDTDESYEDSDDSEGFGEDRASRQRKRQARRTARRERRQGRRDRRHGVSRGKPSAPPSKAAVQDAFANVKQDMAKAQTEVKKAEARQSNEQMNDIIATILFRPTLKTAQMEVTNENGEKIPNYHVTLKDKDGNPIIVDDKVVTEVGYKIEDNLIPLLAVKLISNMKGIDTSKGINQFLPLGIGLLLSTSAQQTLGLRSKDSTSTGLNLDNLLKNPAVLLLAAFLFMQNTKK